MHAHKARVNVTDAREVRLTLPSDFPPGDAEVTVTAEAAPGRDKASPTGQRAAEEFEAWLGGLLKRLPTAPVLPPEAMDRVHIYDE
jgi:hypothetical protein